MKIKGIKRENKRLKKRYGMKVVGRSVFAIEQELGKRAQKQRGAK